MTRLRVAFALILGGSGLPILFAQGGPTPGISWGGLLGIVATWIGVAFGYFAMRRNLRDDQEKNTKRIAHECVNAELTKRGATFMDRREQEIINKQNDERYRTITSLDEFAGEVRRLAEAVERNTNTRRQ